MKLSTTSIITGLFVCQSIWIQSQHQVTTFAGSSQGYLDGSSASSRFFAPTDACVSPDGAFIYVADYSGHRIRKINKTTNQVSTLAGNGTSGNSNGVGQNAQFSFPTGLAISSDGSLLFVADNGNSLIRKISLSDNTVVTIAGDGNFDHADNANGLSASFNQPSDLVLRGDSVLFITDTENHVIRKMNLSTTEVTTVVGYVGVNGFLDGIGTAAAVSYPAGITISADGASLYLADNGNNMIRKISLPDYTVAVFAGNASPSYSDNVIGIQAGFYSPQGISIDPLSTYLYVSDTYNHRIRKINLTTTEVVTIAGDGSVPPASTFANNSNGLQAKFFYPTNCAVSPDGLSIYVADQGNFKIREVKTDMISNAAPQANDDTVNTDENTAVSINVTLNDTDTDGTIDASTVDLDPTSGGIQNTFAALGGAFSVNSSGLVTFTPDNGFTGTVIATYTVNDNSGTSSNSATLTATVTGTSGLFALQNNEMLLFPNPTSDYIRIKTKNSLNAIEIKFSDAQGQLIEIPFSSNPDGLLIDLGLLPAGKYYVMLLQNGQTIEKHGIIKMN